MNIIDLMGLLGVILVLWGVGRQINSILALARGTTDKDLRPITGFAYVAIGWYLLLVVTGAAVKAGIGDIIYITSSLLNAAGVVLLLSGALMIIGTLLLLFMSVTGE